MRLQFYLGIGMKSVGIVCTLLLVIQLCVFLSLPVLKNLPLDLSCFAEVSEAYAQPPERIISAKDRSEMVLVPGGPFIFGINQAEMREIVRRLKEKVEVFYERELPKQEKTLPAFYIDRYEVTNEQYAIFLKATGHRQPRYQHYPQFNNPRQPVVGVGWPDAEAYCSWANKRLPTEEEWEKAARGTDGRVWPWGDVADSTRYNGRKKGLFAPVHVGSFPAGNSPYGASDMAGNVWEMTSSNWVGNSKAMKGGSFLNTDADVRVTVRWAAKDEEKGANWLGFRCVMDAEQYLREQKKK